MGKKRIEVPEDILSEMIRLYNEEYIGTPSLSERFGYHKSIILRSFKLFYKLKKNFKNHINIILYINWNIIEHTVDINTLYTLGGNLIWFTSCFTFIFASTCENMPNILIEGMSSGLPILCSNYLPMPEFLKDI